MKVKFTNFTKEFKSLIKSLNLKFNEIVEGNYILGKELEILKKLKNFKS